MRSLLRKSTIGIAIGSLGLIATSCQSYQAKPIDPASIREAWQQLDWDSPGVHQLHSTVNPDDAGYDASDGKLSYSEAATLSLYLNPELREARAEAGVAHARAEHAGVWDDPGLSADVLRILDSADESWIYGVGISISIPIFGSKAAERALAQANASTELVSVLHAEWHHLHELRETWATWKTEERKLAIRRQTAVDLRAVQGIANTLADAGQISRAEGRFFTLALKQQEVEIAREDGHLQELKRQLFELLGVAPDAPLELVGDSPAVVYPDNLSQQLQHFEAGNFHLREAAAEYHAADQALKLEIKRQYPDLELGPLFENEEGDWHGGIGFGIRLPIWNRNKGGIATAEAAREASAASYRTTYKRLRYQLEKHRAHIARLTDELQVYRTEVLPLCEEQLSEIRETARLGQLNVFLLREALESRSDAQFKIAELGGELRRERIALHRILGQHKDDTKAASNKSTPEGGEEK